MRTSSWRCGGIFAKHPPQASRCTYTIPSPLREFFRILLNACSRRGSMESSRFLDFSRSFSSSAFVSAMISSSSFFFISRSWLRPSSICWFFSRNSSLLFSCVFASRIRLLQSSISSCWNSISLFSRSYSRLLATLSSCSLYLASCCDARSILVFISLIRERRSLTSFCVFSIRVFNPSISSSRSSTSSGSSPRRIRILSISDSINCN